MIKIGCLLDQKDGAIARRFAETRYMIVVDAETYKVLKCFPRGKMTDTELARWVLEEDLEAIITGPMEEGPFTIIAEEGMITRYNGVGRQAMDAVRQMNAYQLDLIFDYEGGTGCHSRGPCHEHAHEGDTIT